MDTRLQAAETLLSNNLPMATLLVTETLDLSNPACAYAALRALLSLGYKKRIHCILKDHPEHLRYYEISFIFLRAGAKHLEISPSESLRPTSSQARIDPESLSCYFLALNKRENIRRRLLLTAFKKDCKNIEALARLAHDSLYSQQGLAALIEESPCNDPFPGWGPAEYKGFLKELFVPNFQDSAASSFFFPASFKLLSPITVSHQATLLYRNRHYRDLFRFAVLARESYPECSAPLEALGMLYLSKNSISEARHCFRKAIDIDSHRGSAHLLLGLAYTLLRDSEEAIASLSTAFSIIWQPLYPAYLLAYEYQQMNNEMKARHFYMVCVELIINEYATADAEAIDQLSSVITDKSDMKNDVIRVINDQYLVNRKILKEDRDNGSLNGADSRGNNAFSAVSSSYIADICCSCACVGADSSGCHCCLPSSYSSLVEGPGATTCSRKYGKTGLASKRKKIYRVSELKPNDLAILNSAIFFFIQNEDYEYAGQLIKEFSVRNILKAFHLLFTGCVEEAKRAVEECPRDGFYYAVCGFLMHLEDKFEDAAKNYERSLVLKRTQAVEDLLSMALKNISGLENNHAFDYTNPLFDELEYRARLITFL